MASQSLVIALISFITAAISVSSSSSLAKPSCLDRCGNITIPFPFGTTPECYRSRPFWVTCNQTSHPPKLFWWNSTIELMNLSLDGQAKLLRGIARDCFGSGRDGTLVDNIWNSIRLASLFTVNTTANKFTMVGCNAEASVSGGRLRRRNNFETGCKAMCEEQSDLLEGSCAGLGCCQLSIPRNVWNVNVTLNPNWTNSYVRNFSDCNYAFVAEESAFRFSPQNLTNLKNVTRLPMVVDWVIDYGECEEAMKNSTSYACKSVNSTCYDPDSGYGYRCRCFDGYDGNPYLEGGCQDIDECEDRSLNTCEHGCKNTIGNYTCPCPKGYRGDGRKGGAGCSRDESFILRLVAGVALGIIVLLLSSILE